MESFKKKTFFLIRCLPLQILSMCVYNSSWQWWHLVSFFMQNISILPLQRALVIQAIDPCWGGVHNCSQFQNRKSLVFASMSSLHQVWKITDLKEICTSAKIIKNYTFVVYSLVEKKLQNSVEFNFEMSSMPNSFCCTFEFPFVINCFPSRTVLKLIRAWYWICSG